MGKIVVQTATGKPKIQHNSLKDGNSKPVGKVLCITQIKDKK